MAGAASLILALTAGLLGVTRPPVTYVLDYGKNHVDQPGYAELVAGSPPQVLHFGKDVPMSHNWGPIATMGGENVAYGKGDDIRRISPAELATRVSRLKELNDGLHRAGVSLILPYICLMTMAGDETRRTGFWEFYDHWEDYAAFDLGPRPSEPAGWMQRTAQGGLKRFYTYGSGYYPGYETNHRYAVSILHPGWRQWQRAVVRQAARAGFDGVFVDNGGSFQSYDPLAQEGFRQWLAARFEPARLQELFGLASAGEASLPASLDGPLGAEALKFWQTSIRDFLAELRREGSEVLGRRFVIFPNGAHNPVTLRYAHPDTDYTMYELSHGSLGTTNTGRLTDTVVEDVSFRHYLSHRYAYAYPVAMGAGTRALVLTRPGYPRRRPEYEMNAAAARLGMAEAAAFGGGGGYLLRPDWTLYGQAMAGMRRFFESQARLFEGYQPDGRVGVLAFVDEALFGNAAHLAAAEAVYTATTGAALPTVLLPEELCTSQGLAGLAAVVLPAVR
ncbi:MAG: hypothetical protein HUU35_15000, partial [Armatimonadetes bacterium]|nr:hypothetical protein [Armatimonadota bacterium]